MQETKEEQTIPTQPVAELVKIPKKKKTNTPEYNKAYYEKHKEATLARLTAKVQCEHCERIVTYQRLPLHKKTPICQQSRLSIALKGKSQEECCQMVGEYLSSGSIQHIF
jgi:hypothetical protein